MNCSCIAQHYSKIGTSARWLTLQLLVFLLTRSTLSMLSLLLLIASFNHCFIYSFIPLFIHSLIPSFDNLFFQCYIHSFFLSFPLLTFPLLTLTRIHKHVALSGDRLAEGQRGRVQMSSLHSHGLFPLGQTRFLFARWQSRTQSRGQGQTQIRPGRVGPGGNVQNGLGAASGVPLYGSEFIAL